MYLLISLHGEMALSNIPDSDKLVVCLDHLTSGFISCNDDCSTTIWNSGAEVLEAYREGKVLSFYDVEDQEVFFGGRWIPLCVPH